MVGFPSGLDLSVEALELRKMRRNLPRSVALALANLALSFGAQIAIQHS